MIMPNVVGQTQRLDGLIGKVYIDMVEQLFVMGAEIYSCCAKSSLGRENQSHLEVYHVRYAARVDSNGYDEVIILVDG